MKIFLVGATGVLGRAVVPMLLAHRDRVVVLVRSYERAAPITMPGVKLFEGDLLREDPTRLRAMLDGCDAAAHLATALREGSPGPGTTNTNAALRTEGTRRLLEAVLAVGVPRYVQQSIALSYIDGGDAWLDEQTPFADASEASASSSPVPEMESLVRALDVRRVEWIILRGGSFVGPDTRQDEVIADLRSGALHVPGDGSNWVSFIHVEDYATAVVTAIHSSASGLALNITDEPVRSGEYVDRLAEMFGLPAPPRDLDLPLPRSYRCTNAAAKETLGWIPEKGIWPDNVRK